MDSWKFLVLVFVVLLVAGAGVTAYSGTSGTEKTTAPPPEPDSACEDGKDNDNDGETDGEDTGCVKPYSEDDSEANLWDHDASWTFSGYSFPDSNGPSVFYGSQVYDSGSDSFTTDESDSSGDGVIKEYSVGGAGPWGSGNWGGGSIEHNVTGVTDAGETDAISSGMWEIIDTPMDGDCGDTLIGSDTTVSCPEDAGLPDDYGESSTTITDELPETDGEVIKYDVDDVSYPFHVREFRPSKDMPSGWTDATGICETWDCPDSDDTKEYTDYVDENTPDFFLKDSQTEIWRVDPQYDSTNWFGTVTDWAVHDSYRDVITGSDSMPGCTDAENCTSVTSTECKSKTSVDVYDYDGTKEVTVGATSGEFTTSSTSNFGKSVDNNPKTWSFDVTVDKEPVKAGSVDVCSNTGTVTGSVCESGKVCDSTSSDGGESYFTTSNQKIDDTTDNRQRQYGFYTVKFPENEVFDLNPDSNPHSVSPMEALFSSDGFKGGSGSWSDVIYLVDGDTAWFSWPVSDDGRNQGNDPAVSKSKFKIDVPADYFESNRLEYNSYDADGFNGQGDGYIAIKDDSDGKRIVGVSPDSYFLQREIQKEQGSASFVSQSDVPVPDCPSDYTKCVASVDVSLKNLDSWSSPNPSDGVSWEFTSGGPYSTSASLSVCKMYKRLSGDDTMSCSFGDDDDDDDYNKPAEPCGDQPNEWWAYMEGPEVDNTQMDKYPGHQQSCIDKTSDCVLHGDDVNEGTVANVEYNSTTGYEKGGSSPDWEVCLAIPGEGDTHDGDNNFPDDGDSNGDIGGEWYDLDSDIVNDYLRGTSLTSGDSNNDGKTNETDVSYYWRENENPYHSQYNPRGGDKGLALEDDCGPDVNGCDDEAGNVDGKDPFFYSFFTQGKRDEDYNPQGEQDEGDSVIAAATYYGYINKMEEDSDQLEPGMATEATWDLSSIDIWSDSVGGTSEADMWAISESLQESISNRGNVFDPGNVYYHKDYTGYKRSRPSHGPVAKDDRVLGNSFADIATPSGHGTWIDPDYIKKGWESGEYRSSMFSSWDDKLTYKMDISGPDSGLGFDLGGTGFTFQDPGRRYIVKGDIYFEGEKDDKDNDGDGQVDEGPSSESWEGTDLVGETSPHLEPPMCGDDQREYLVEEIGESQNPEKLDGAYACVDQRDVCVDLDSNPRVVESGSYKNVGEPDENFGRLKNDKEVCARADDNPDDDVYKWYDQDFGDIDGDGNQETCRENTLYGSKGVRWIDAEYVRDYPFAVRKGIDDDWNANLAQLANRDKFTGELTSRPEQTSWDFNTESPVPTGSPNETIATLGFCGGDDGDEQIVTQRCRAQACDTDTSVIGVVEANEKSSCILDQAKYPQVSGDKRQIYQPGESVTFDYGSSTREVSCFDGVWYDEWPIVFQQDRMDIGKGETRNLGFSVINIRPEAQKYRVELVDTEVSQFAEFGSREGDSFVVEVPAQGAKSFSVEVYGGDTSIGSDTDYADLRVQATAINGDVSGEDRAGINIKETVQTGSGEEAAGPKNVPGVGFVQLLALSLVSTLLFFSQS